MKEFNIEFLKKSKFNLTLSFLALCLLFISIITMTYCWIEGSASIEIKNAEGNPITVSDTNKSLYILSDTSSTTTINLASYIDNNTSLFLAPAKSVDGKTIQIKNGDSFRNATVNDINNNYIEFDVKFNAPTETKFTFTNDSEITIDGAPTRSIKMSLEVDDIVQKTMSGDALSDQEAFVSLGQHVLTVRIWLDCETAGYENLYGKTVDFNFTLATQKNVTNLTFIDRTASQTAQYLTSGKTMKVVYIANGQTVTTNMTTETNNTFSVSEIPISALPTVEFQCFNGTTMVAKWSGTAARVNGSFTAYGSIFSTTDYGYGTWEDVVKVNFKDNSIDSTFNPSGNYVTITNNIDLHRYNMYYNSTSKIWSAYVPKTSFTVSGNETRKMFINSRDINGTSINYTEIDVSVFGTPPALETTYSVYGDSGIKGVDFNDSLYYGTWCDTADLITIKSYDSTISGLASTKDMMVSFDESNKKYYKAKYDSTNKIWTVNVPTDPTTLEFSIDTYTFDGNLREKVDDKYIYSITSTTAGSWTYINNINVKVESNAYSVVTATYVNSDNTTVTIAEGETKQVPEGTELTLTAQFTGSCPGLSNGHKFVKFTVNSTDYATNNQKITVGDQDLTITTFTTPRDFYLVGDCLNGGNWSSTNNKMAYMSVNNTMTSEFTTSIATDAKIKIVMDDVSKRNDAAYSVTLNNPTVNFSGCITKASISGSGVDQCVYFDSPVGSTIKVTYNLANNTISLSGTKNTKTIKVGVISYVYNETSANEGNYQIHYWNNSGVTGDATCVYQNVTETKDVGYWSSAQTFRIYSVEIPADSTGFKFHINDRYFGGDGDALTQSSVYVFNYSGDKALYE